LGSTVDFVKIRHPLPTTYPQIKMPTISVVTAVYNGVSFLRETIDSILAQSFSDFEYLLVDDCSTDGSVALIESYKDPRIRLVRRSSNGGIVATRNQGFAMATGEFLALIDQDDLACPDRFAEQLKAFSLNPKLGIAATWVDYVDEKSQPLPGAPRRKYNSKELHSFLLFVNPFSNSSLLVRREAIKTPAYDPAFALCEDYHFIVTISRQWEVCMLQQVLNKYRIHSSNYSKVAASSMNQHELKLKRLMLSTYGLEVAESDLTYHHDLGKKVLVAMPDSLANVGNWLVKLVSSVRTEGQSMSLSADVVADVWWEYCRSSHRSGIAAFTTYFSVCKRLSLRRSYIRGLSLLLRSLLAPLQRRSPNLS
jgi:hypothetical protein